MPSFVLICKLQHLGGKKALKNGESWGDDDSLTL